MSRLAVYLLGPPRVELDEKPIHIGRRKVLALLVYLVMINQRHSREALAALLAPESDHARARADLRRTLSLLNSLLGDCLTVDRTTVGLRRRAPCYLDVNRFRQCLATCQKHGHPTAFACPQCVPHLEEAAALYQGGFLAGFCLPNSLPFDEWQRFESEALHQDLSSALERLVSALGAQRDDETAIIYARRWLELNLTHEPAHRALIELYGRTGQTSAALHQYEFCEQTMAEELGVPPSAETTALYERLRTGEFDKLRSITPDNPRCTPEIPHNLPPQPTPFVGRETELAELDQLIADPHVRLITIVGPGGIGKTRLALTTAERQLTHLTDSRICESTIRRERLFPDGIFFVPLGPLSTPDDITFALAQVLNIQLQSGTNRTPNQQISDHLHSRRTLLILDNFEHLLEGATLLSDLVLLAPEIQILVTSQERLQLQQERVYAIQGLECPDLESPETVEWCAAARLFSLSAQRVNRDFAIDAQDVTSLVDICRLVEGMPLAIELAAAWADTMSLADIATEIQGGIDFLAREWQDIPQRHRSMRAAIDTSWRRITPFEQEIFSQLCVFRGGFTREAALALTGSSIRVLTRLVSRTLLQYDSGQDRYHIQRLLRQYAEDRLAADAAQEISARERHSAFFGAAVQRWEADLKGARQRAAWTEFDADVANVSASWEWAGSQLRLDRLNQMLDGLCLFYMRPFRPRRGQTFCRSVVALLDQPGSITQVSLESDNHRDTVRLLAKALAWETFFDTSAGVASDPRLRRSLDLLNSPALAAQNTSAEHALVLKMMGYFEPDTMRETTELEESQRVLGQSLSLSRKLGDHWQQAHTQILLASVAAALEEPKNAKRMYEECLILSRRLGDEWMYAETLRLSGRLALSEGDYDQADGMLTESLELSLRHNKQMESIRALGHLSRSALDQGNYAAAVDYARRSMRICRETGDRYSLSLALFQSGDVYLERGEFDQAQQELEECRVIAIEMGLSRHLVGLGVRQVRSKLYGGRYKEARDAMTTLWERVGTMGERYWTGQTHLLQGLLALVDGKPELARESMLESVADQRRCAQHTWLPYSLSALGLASIRSGNQTESRRHVCEALKTEPVLRASQQVKNLPCAVVAGVLVAVEDPHLDERAIELYALATSRPLVKKSPFFEEVVGRHISRTAANLPQEVVAAAEERGRALDWWETAEALLVELQALGWAGVDE